MPTFTENIHTTPTLQEFINKNPNTILEPTEALYTVDTMRLYQGDGITKLKDIVPFYYREELNIKISSNINEYPFFEVNDSYIPTTSQIEKLNTYTINTIEENISNVKNELLEEDKKLKNEIKNSITNNNDFINSQINNKFEEISNDYILADNNLKKIIENNKKDIELKLNNAIENVTNEYTSKDDEITSSLEENINSINTKLNDLSQDLNQFSSATVGNSKKPIYINNGTPIASNASVGSSTKHIYMSNGTITESNANIGSNSNPVYMSNGTITKLNSTIGNSTNPIFINEGEITNCKPYSEASVNNSVKWNGSNKTISQNMPSGGSNGDIWFRYV